MNENKTIAYSPLESDRELAHSNKMSLENKILSDLIIWMKYARYLPESGRRETWEELCDRNMKMHIKKYPQLEKEIKEVYKEHVIPKKVLPSMRSLQFGEKAIEVNESRIYNCSYMPVNNIKFFSELMFLLLGGSGVGYSVQNHHIIQLPPIKVPEKYRKFVIEDSIAGWADAIKVLFKSFTQRNTKPNFDFSQIRPKGAELITAGGKAPGPAPLKVCLTKIENILENANERKLTSLEVHEIACHIADAVLSGGIRRAAMICLFDLKDYNMLTCKSGNWWELHPEFARANNSVVLKRGKITYSQFQEVWNRSKESGSGEPGVFWTSNGELGSNPCFSGQEELLTPQGYKTFEELETLNHIEIVNKNGDIVESRVWKSGVKDTVIITNSISEETICTSDHEWMTTEGKTVQTKELKGKRLMPFLNKRDDFNNLYIKLGFIQGDGSLGRLKSIAHKGLEIHIGEKDDDVLDYFKFIREGNQTIFYTTQFSEICRNLEFDSSSLPKRSFPKTFYKWSYIEKLSFLRGLYSANGSIIKNSRIAFKSTSKELILQLQEFFNSINISTYYTTNKSKENVFKNGIYKLKESYDLNIGRFEDMKRFYENIGFIHKYKMDSLYELVLSKSPKIMSIKENENIDVYDFTEPETHWGVVNGYIAHNCLEISLKPNGFCNLTEINASTIESQEDFNKRCAAASFLGTLQAGYTDFYYLRDEWKDTAEEEALLGVSMTGIASNSLQNINVKEGAKIVKKTNKYISKKIGINKAKRTTCIKPAGTTSLVLGTSSGIHAYHSPYYKRRIRLNKSESIYKYLSYKIPELVEDDYFRPHDTAVLTIPQKSPKNAIFRDESSLHLLERSKKIYKEWILSGHTEGVNTHNVSITVSVKDDEWDKVGTWMWSNKDYYSGISVLPFDGGTHKQAPFEECGEEEYNELSKYLRDINLEEVREDEDYTHLTENLACSGNSCEVN